MEVSEISFERQWEGGKDVNYLQYYLTYSCKKVMQKSYFSVHRRRAGLQPAVKKNSQQLTERLDKSADRYGVELNPDKSKIIVNSIKSRPSTNICMNGRALKVVDKFKYTYNHTNQRRKIKKRKYRSDWRKPTQP